MKNVVNWFEIYTSDFERAKTFYAEVFKCKLTDGPTNTDRHSQELCSYFEPGRYACVCCDTALFDAEEKFESKTGWPSFTQPIKEKAVAYYEDNLFGMRRIEARCNTCDAHLGHAFKDRPMPSGLRYCINALSLNKITVNEEKVDFGGGCFWCTEAIFRD